jgi:hypothetical protein
MAAPRECLTPEEEQSRRVRFVSGIGWQVLLESSSQWHTCRQEQDACFIASGLRTSDAVRRGEVCGAEIADELDAVAAVAARVLGVAEAERITHAAEYARRQSAT